MSKTLNEGCADLQQYPASKACQLAKKLKSSKATACHIKQATSNAQAAQINLLRHQRTELSQKKKRGHKQKQHFKSKDSKPPYKKCPNPSQAHGSQNHCSKCGDTRHAQGFSCPAKKYLCKACKKYGHFTSLCFSKQKKTAYQITAEGMEDNSATKQDNSPVNMQIEVKMVRRKVDTKEYYADVFEGVGRFSGPPYHIQVDPNVPPKQTPVRPVPVHLKEAFKQELDKMLQAGQLKPVHEATPWINSYMVVEGKDKLD